MDNKLCYENNDKTVFFKLEMYIKVKKVRIPNGEFDVECISSTI